MPLKGLKQLKFKSIQVIVKLHKANTSSKYVSKIKPTWNKTARHIHQTTVRHIFRQRKKTNRWKLFLRQLSKELAKRSANHQIMGNHWGKVEVESFLERLVVELIPRNDERRVATGRRAVVGACCVSNEQPNHNNVETQGTRILGWLKHDFVFDCYIF